MDNEEMLLVIKDIFDKTVNDIKLEIKSEICEVKNQMGVLIEKLEGNVQAIAEGHGITEVKIGNVQNSISQVKHELSDGINTLKKDINVIKDYIIKVDSALNEHEVILKRVK